MYDVSNEIPTEKSFLQAVNELQKLLPLYSFYFVNRSSFYIIYIKESVMNKYSQQIAEIHNKYCYNEELNKSFIFSECDENFISLDGVDVRLFSISIDKIIDMFDKYC